MGLIDDITANGKGRAVAIVGILTCAFVLAGFSFFHYIVQDDSLVGNGQSIESVLREQHDKLGDLRGRIEIARSLMESGKKTADEIEAVSRDLKTAGDAVAARTGEVARLTAETSKQQADLKSYQQTYRDQTWKAAIGEKIPVMTLKSGKHYEDVTILGVNAGGLEIGYADGRSRISPNDLDAAWQRRFDW